MFRGHLIRRFGVNWRKKIRKLRAAAEKDAYQRSRKSGMLSKYLACLDYYKTNKLVFPLWLEGGYSTWCGTRIQAWWRM